MIEGNPRSATRAVLDTSVLFSEHRHWLWLATAIAGSADFIVSLNTRDFPADGRAAGIRFLTPRDFLSILIAQHPDAGLEQRAQESTGYIP